MFTTRGGEGQCGHSKPPFDSLNFGDHVGDNPKAVAANRAEFQKTIGVRPVFLKQVHGTKVLNLSPQTTDGESADASISTQANLACTIMVADCLPVLFTDFEGTFVAAAHAGWRGLVNGILGDTLASISMRKTSFYAMNTSFVATNTIAWLGPCIGSTAFEVGDEVRTAFLSQSTFADCYFQPVGGGKWLANLAGLARSQLQMLGIPSSNLFGNDASTSWCTVEQEKLFFSHRRDAARLGSTGRMAACIWLATTKSVI